MAGIGWTGEAKRWLEDIFEHIAAENPAAAASTARGIYERPQVLDEGPSATTGCVILQSPDVHGISRR